MSIRVQFVQRAVPSVWYGPWTVTGMSAADVHKALSQLEDDQCGAERRDAASPRVAEVRAILEEVFDDPATEEEAWSSAGPA